MNIEPKSSLISLPGRAIVRVTRMALSKGSKLSWREVKQQLIDDMDVALAPARYISNDPNPPRRTLLFTMSNGNKPIPKATKKDGPGTAAISAAPQKPFQPTEIVINGTDRPTSEGGTRGLLITSLFVGADLQMVNIPGQSSGIPVEYFNGAQSRNFMLDAAYPAIGISIGICNPTPFPVKEFHVTITGKAIS